MNFHPPFNSSTYNALDKAIKGSPGAGLNLPNICDICGKPRATASHVRCSKLRQRAMRTAR